MEWIQKILDFDTELFLFLNSFYSHFWDTIMLLITRKEIWLPFYIVIIFYIIKNFRSKSVLILFMLALTILSSDQLSVLIKESVQRLRPVYEPEIQYLVHNVLRKGGLFGFVSSHAANTFAIFIFTSRIFKNRNYYYLLLFWAILISYSRIYSGVHYPLDLLGGAVLGWFLALVFYKILLFLENHFFIARSPKITRTCLKGSQAGIVFLVFSVLVSTFFIVVFILHHYKYL